MNNLFKIDFEVRDNEIDIQGIVNNSNYHIYLCHARHLYLKHIGISFADLAEKKQFLLLLSTHVEFKRPLRSEDRFFVTCKMVPHESLRVGFEQEIKRHDEKETLIVKSYQVGVCIDGNNRNRPYLPDIIKHHFVTPSYYAVVKK